ncbi:endonuclease-reverse transcriptase [Plakobranchus ocellatus]|uniref:Endonuclease-reverse transcriptase n=1 Tax=Plakobranchus ocellatus TaxID=259542 RepID=A0AAV4C416_9GAST|nr:endonuclease-reverse transcriptase [Plakobranchus ocellatus]
MRMIRARIEINSRLERLKRIQRKRPIKTNTEILEMHKEQFLLGISNRFNALEENKPTIETFHKIMEDEAERFGKNGKDKPNEKLEEDMEIERKLYEQTTPDQPMTLTSSPIKEKMQPFLQEEVKETLDEMKKKKAPKNDGITSDVMKIGGPQVIKYMTKVYNEVLKNYEKAFHSVEHGTIIQALRKVNINENYVTMIENVYKGATERIHIDNQISIAFEIQRGVRQGDPISPKLFITVIEQVFKEADLKYGINIDGEYLRDLRFADDVALCIEKEEEMEEHLERLNSESKKVGLKIHKGKTKYRTNYITERPIIIDNENIELATKYTYPGQTTTMKNGTNEEIITRIRKAWYTFGKYREILQDTTLPITLKRKNI